MGGDTLQAILERFDTKELERMMLSDPDLYAQLAASFWSFQPRPDRPELFDEQTSFFKSRDAVAFLLGGNGSGKTEAAAAKVAHFLLQDQPAPRRDTPFWVVSNTYYQVCAVCWGEKLHGKQYIPDGDVDWDRVRWISQAEGWPRSVPLKPWVGRPETNWVLEFHSYEQGRKHLQARSIGGFWLSEQFTWDVFQEVLRGCRDYMFLGGQVAEFTPIDPELCLELEKLLDDWPKDWGLYRLNTELNRPNLADGWYENFLAAIPDEMRATRLTGALAIYEGAIFQSFSPSVHVVEDAMPGQGGRMYCGIDWGASAEHPLAAVWGWRTDWGEWLIFDEYWSNRQDITLRDHFEAIRERNKQWGISAEIYADNENAMAIAQFGQWGVPIAGARKDVLDSIDMIRSLLKVQLATNKPRLQIASRCKHLIEEIRKYRWEKRKNIGGGVPPARPIKRDDDCVDALRYMIYTAEKHIGKPPGALTYRPEPARHGVRLTRTR